MAQNNNTGYYNTGNYNTGSRNTGYLNTGNYNTGSRNTGSRNTGNNNTSSRNTGYYNTGNYNTGSRNTGSRNTGYLNTGNNNTSSRNTGYLNTGNNNTGNYNTGSRNTGSRNTGNNNTGSYHVGCFNTVDAKKAYFFNQLIDKKLWDDADKPDWLFMPELTSWVQADQMTVKEKMENPNYKTTGGFLRVNDMKEEWRKAYEYASPEDIELTKQLPAFDAEVFFEITGIDFRYVLHSKAPAPCEGRELEIDGVTYILTEKK